MKKLFFLAILIVIGIANVKAQKSTINTLFPNKETEIAAQKQKEDVAKKDVATPTKQRLFQNYTQGAQRTSFSAAKRKAVSNTKTVSESEIKVDKTEPKAEVKQPPMQQETSTKQ
ncbi:hypothetical protein ACTJKC_13455 [Pedobacter sp. 22226]|uniref:hypothetical protein n=1 Tax=Pedobacter sp. 22226 TaxID=3453894 RepID=UPI003F87A14D